MKGKVFVVALCFVTNSIYHVYGEKGPYRRYKRDVTGTLDIITNNAQPIHADVKLDQGKDGNEKPCPKPGIIPHIEPGTVFQVTPPKDGIELKALRRAPIENTHTNMSTTNTLDIIRTVNRVVTVLVLLGSLCIEFFPLFKKFSHYVLELVQG